MGSRGIGAAQALRLGGTESQKVLVVSAQLCAVAAVETSVGKESLSRIVSPRLDEARRKTCVQPSKFDRVHARRDRSAVLAVARRRSRGCRLTNSSIPHPLPIFLTMLTELIDVNSCGLTPVLPVCLCTAALPVGSGHSRRAR